MEGKKVSTEFSKCEIYSIRAESSIFKKKLYGAKFGI
jgi:hypothetical protein